MGLLDELLGHNEDPANYADVETMFGRAQVYDVEGEDGDVFRVLDVAGTWQSASYVDDSWSELVFGYHQHFTRAFATPREAKSVLMLGGGGFAFPKWVLTHRPGVAVDVVEIDPVVVDLAEQWFFLDQLNAAQRSHLRTISDDALTYLKSFAALPPEVPRYDLVANDLFAAEKPPAELMGPQGAQLIASVLAPEGIYVTNVVSAIKGRRARPLQTVVEALESVFEQVEVVSLGEDEPRVPDNNVVFATNGDYSLGGVLASS